MSYADKRLKKHFDDKALTGEEVESLAMAVKRERESFDRAMSSGGGFLMLSLFILVIIAAGAEFI